MEDRETYSIDDLWADLDKFALDSARNPGDITTQEIMGHYGLSKYQAIGFIQRAVASGEYEYVRWNRVKVLRKIKK